MIAIEIFVDAAIMPKIQCEQMPSSDERLGYAGSSPRNRLGRIDKKLGHFIEAMERRSACSS
jgi:hypothetical protein